MILDDLATIAREAARAALQIDPGPLGIDFTEDATLGDFTVNCFHLAKTLKRPPPAIAAALAPALIGRGCITGATAVSGYVNITVSRTDLFRDAITPIVTDPEHAGRNTTLAGRRMLVEFSAPNTNKPQHLGHLRNNFLGDSVARVLANAGADVVRVNLINDRGIHICKSMLTYQRFGNGATPASTNRKGDHFVGDFYVRFETEFRLEVDTFIAANPDAFATWSVKHALDRKSRPVPADELAVQWRASFKEENFGLIPLGAAAQDMLRKWEAGDADVVNLWKLMNGWVIEGFNATYARLGIRFDRIYLESETYQLGRDLILAGLERGVFSRRPDGAVEIDLSAHGLGRKVVLRSDGTSVYMTQDIGTTVLKATQHTIDGQIWVVADEQKHHFNVLFKILELMGYSWAAGCHHLAYGLVNLPEGRMKSREGTVVDADDLMDEVATLARDEITSRDATLAPAVLNDRAEKITLAALRFMLLKVNPLATMVFNPKESVAFEGETGPYLLYTIARIRRMVADGGIDARAAAATFQPAELGTPTEVALARALLGFTRATARAAREYNPAAIAAWMIDVAQAYNSYYQDVPILKAPVAATRDARLLLSAATATALDRAASLLGITTLERM